MRAAHTLATLDEIGSGDHVCQLLGPADDVMDRSRAFVADGALFGDKVVIVGSAVTAGSEFAPMVLDPSRTGGSLLAAVRREAASAGREGFRSLRVLHHVTPGTGAGEPEQLLRSELDLEEFAADSGALVVCAYSGADWDASTLEQVRCVHPHHLGSRPASPAFQVYRTGKDGWTVDGVIDSDGAAAFGAILRTLLAQTATVRLLCRGLEFFDAAGMSALADAARLLPDRKVVLEGTNDTVRLAWELSGFAAPAVPVVMAP
ncbi:MULTISPECIES: MEDS domain-containing protein [Streptomyces]|uniref:Antagonist protein n=2 Tax=Streptomyces TaxID=1883 RepID=A0A2U9PBA0_STRAS|nr:MEDS domain-containing protein [Streptomyces actuosus]AWT47070.1 antagonist protein [Streptomyces actuosus]MBM4823747.1 MEDS domain-containing protein [Streptomyces actuosus]